MTGSCLHANKSGGYWVSWRICGVASSPPPLCFLLVEAVLEMSGGLYYRILNGNDGLEAVGPWESGLVSRLWEPEPGHAAAKDHYGLVGGQWERGVGCHTIDHYTPNLTLFLEPEGH